MQINALKDADADASYYTVHGKVFVGPAQPKKTNCGLYIKEDLIIKDESGEIALHVWEPLYNDLSDKETYTLTHTRLRKYLGNWYISTSSSSKLSQSESLNISDDTVDFSTTTTTVIEKIEAVGLVDRFVSCNKCKKKITNIEPGAKLVKCLNCKTTKRIGDVKRGMIIPIIILHDAKELKLLAPENALDTVVPIDDEDAMIEKLMELENVTITFNKKSHFVSKISVSIEENLHGEQLDEDDTAKISVSIEQGGVI